MIDNPLQNKYKNKINSSWTYENADEILIDFYQNLKIEDNTLNILLK